MEDFLYIIFIIIAVVVKVISAMADKAKEKSKKRQRPVVKVENPETRAFNSELPDDSQTFAQEDSQTFAQEEAECGHRSPMPPVMDDAERRWLSDVQPPHHDAGLQAVKADTTKRQTAFATTDMKDSSATSHFLHHHKAATTAKASSPLDELQLSDQEALRRAFIASEILAAKF